MTAIVLCRTCDEPVRRVRTFGWIHLVTSLDADHAAVPEGYDGWSLCPRPTCHVPDTACVMGFDVDTCPHRIGASA